MVEITSAPTTRLEIISAAITLTGKQQTVNTLDSGGPLAADGEKLYDILVSAELSSNRWRFAQQFQQISVINTLEPTFDNWQFFFQVPSDAIMILYVTPNVDYLVFGDRILTRNDQPQTLVYTRDVPVSKWPGAFSMYIVYHLASMLGLSVTNSDRMVARLAAGLKMWESRALFADGQNSRTHQFRFNPYVDVRYRNSTRRTS